MGNDVIALTHLGWGMLKDWCGMDHSYLIFEGFLKWGYSYLQIIDFNVFSESSTFSWFFSVINQPAIGIPHIYGNPIRLVGSRMGICFTFFLYFPLVNPLKCDVTRIFETIFSKYSRYNVGPPSDGTMVYKPHENYSYRYHKP